MTETNNKTNTYLNTMYASVERMNAYYLAGDLKSVEAEKTMQREIKREFFSIKRHEQ